VLRTHLCDLFGIDLPIMNAPMGGAAGGELAAAVSEAGGLGLIAGSSRDADWLRAQIRLVRERTDRPFGVGFISHWLPQTPALYAVAIEERVPVIAHSFTDPAPYMAAAREIGAKVICQVRDLEGAREAQRAGVDAIVAQGTEAGGHTGDIATLPLVPLIVDAVAPLPVLAAGGIADGRGLAAVLMLGAQGAWLGTAFLASPESLYRPRQKARVLRMAVDETVLTEVWDLALGREWPRGVAGRAARNAFSERWHGHEQELMTQRAAVAEELRRAQREDDPELEPIWAGQAAGLVRAPEPAGEVVRRIAREAEAALRAGCALLSG
jgi:nitronate monooxygenase